MLFVGVLVNTASQLAYALCMYYQSRSNADRFEAAP